MASDGELSDDEVFIGKLTIKEIRKHIYMGRPRCANTSLQEEKLSFINSCNLKKEDQNSSFKIVETHSQPNLNSDSPCVISKEVRYRESDASFLEMEQFVEKLCTTTPRKAGSNEKLNNTFEIVEYILKHGPGNKKNEVKKENSEQQSPENEANTKIETDMKTEDIKIEKSNIKKEPITVNRTLNEKGNKIFETPAKKEIGKMENDIFKTPATSMKLKPVFKTPMTTPQSNKKATGSSSKKIPLEAKYKDIMSPVASYINQSPQTPLVRKIHHKKTLKGLSLIPLPDKVSKAEDKENLKLPSKAYKSAKVTKVVNLPEEKKLPKSCTKTYLPKPMIMKHIHREVDPKCPKTDNIEESFANLSCQQAEISVCTQKSAYKVK